MLNIPEKVKERLDRDGTRKNLRLVWENGRADITNENIVSESLDFRESVCSRDSLTFGTAEASTLEFETVGVENLIGCWFSAFIEVDMSDTPGTWESRQDLDYPVYPIPLGRFVVTACPRNHEAVAHRKFTASSKFDRAGLLLQPDAVQAFQTGAINQPFIAKFQARVSSERFEHSYGLAPETKLQPERTSIGTIENIRLSGDENYHEYARVEWWVNNRRVGLDFAYVSARVFGRTLKAEVDGKPVELTESRAQAVAAALTEALYAKYNDVKRQNGEPIEKTEALAELGKILTAQFEKEQERGVFINYSLETVASSASSYTARPVQFDLVRSGNASEVSIPPIDLEVIAPSAAYIAFNTCRANCLEAVSLYTAADRKQDLAVWLAPSETIELRTYRSSSTTTTFALSSSVTSVKNERGSWDADLSPLLPQAQNMLLSLAELYGGFIGKDRYGKASLKRLTLEPTATLRPDQYSSCWFDEYDIEPIGLIRYKFKNEDYVFNFGEGKSAYNIEKTDYLEGLPEFQPESVEEFLSQSLVPALAGLSYVPAEIEAVNVPYLEAGDRVNVELADGSEIETYILERNQQGIQLLSDSLTADGITLQELIEQELEEEEV